MSNSTDKELDRILKNLWLVYYNKGLADDYYIAQSEAKSAITQLINNAVVAARKDEQDEIYNLACDSFTDGTEFNRFVMALDKRQKALTKKGHNSGKDN